MISSLVFLFLIFPLVFTTPKTCPKNCECTKLGTERWRVDCSGVGLVAVGADDSLHPDKVLSIGYLPPGTRELILSNNHIRTIHGFTFATLFDLEILNLSDNDLSVMSPYVFSGLENLITLNLSSNNIHSVNGSIFVGLQSLERLLLDNNPLPAVSLGSFKQLNQLKYLDISSEHLTCDCNVRWLTKWVRRNKVKLSPNTKCKFPLSLRGKQLKKVKRKLLLCTKFKPPIFELRPRESSLIFLKGYFNLSCHVSNVAGQKVTLEWFHDGHPVAHIAGRQELKFSYNPDRSLVIATVNLFNIERNDQGEWTCRAETRNEGWTDKRVRLEVLHINLIKMICAQEVEKTPKGDFEWPATEAGKNAVLECPHGLLPSESSRDNGSVVRRCSEDGFWSEDNILDDSHCDYASDLIRTVRNEILVLSQDDINKQRVQLWNNLAELLRNQTNSLGSTELQFSSRAMMMLPATGGPTELSVFSLLLNTSLDILIESDVGDSLRSWLEGYRPRNGSISTPNVAVCDITAKLDDKIDGLGFLALYSGKKLICAPYKSNSVYNKFDKGSCSVRLPSATLSQLVPETLRLLASLRFAWLNDSRLLDANSQHHNVTWISETNVLALKLDNPFRDGTFESISPRFRRSDDTNETFEEVIERFPLSEQTIRFRFEIIEPTENVFLGIWNQTSLQWIPKMDYCSSVFVGTKSLIFDCHSNFLVETLTQLQLAEPSSFTYFTALQDINELKGLRRVKTAVILMPWMYGTAGLVSCCLMIATLAYCYCPKSVRISKKLRHCLINSWFSISLLCMIFTLGIDKVYMTHVCLTISVILHYLSLVALLWIVVTLRTVQRKLWKSVFPPPPSEDGGLAPVSQHGPLLGLYFLAWGLPIMPFAFTLAVRMPEYTRSKTYCFLSPGAPLYGALLIPAGLMFMVALCLFFNGCCLLRPKHKPITNAHTADESAQLLIVNNNNTTNGPNAPSVLSLQSTIIDVDRSPSGHVWYAGCTLILFILSYICAVLYVARTEVSILKNLPYSTYLLSGLYCFFLFLLSLLIVSAHLASRPGIRFYCCCFLFTHSPTPSVNQPISNGHMTSNDRVQRRNVGVDAIRGVGTAETRGSSSGSHHEGDPNFMIHPQNERFLKAVAKRYHQKQQKRRHDETRDELTNGIIYLQSDGLQTEVIIEEEELSSRAANSPLANGSIEQHDYVNVSVAAKMLQRGQTSPVDGVKLNMQSLEGTRSSTDHSETRI